MKKKHQLLIAVAALLAIVGPVYFGARSAGRVVVTAPGAAVDPQPSVRAERVEVVHFHATQQCATCKTVGRLALKTITERFPKEYADGTVVFLDIDGSKPENQAMVTRFRATASSLCLNAVAGGQDHIEDDADVWRLVYSESKYVEHLESRIRQLLGK
jgi:hypothetical protein